MIVRKFHRKVAGAIYPLKSPKDKLLGALNGTMIGLAECLFYPPNRDHALVKLSTGGCRVSKPPEALLVVEMRSNIPISFPWACIMAKRPWNSERVDYSYFEAIVTTARL